MTAQAGHAQLQTVALLPVAAMLAIGAVRAELVGAPWRARGLGIGLAALMAAWLLTAYYPAWFTLYAAAIFVPCWLAVSGAWRPTRLAAILRAHGATLAIVAGAFALFAVPFLCVYLPRAGETGGHAMDATRPFLVWFWDPANVGERHYWWGWLLRPARWLIETQAGVDRADIELGGEHVTGFPLILLALIVVSLGTLVRRGRPVAWRALALAAIVSWASTIQAGALSPWGLVHALVPGAKGLRVVLRYQLVLILPLLVIVAVAQRERLRRLAARPWLFGAVAAVLVAEQLAPVDGAQLSRRRQLALLAVQRPPADCASFYVVKARAAEPVYIGSGPDALYPHNVDAMFLAMRWRVPTLNGYATFVPLDWAFDRPHAPDYDARVLAYARAHHLTGVCRLDARQPIPWRRLV